MINLQLSDEEARITYNVLEKEYRRLEKTISLQPLTTKAFELRKKTITQQNNVWGIMDALTPFI